MWLGSGLKAGTWVTMPRAFSLPPSCPVETASFEICILKRGRILQRVQVRAWQAGMRVKSWDTGPSWGQHAERRVCWEGRVSGGARLLRPGKGRLDPIVLIGSEPTRKPGRSALVGLEGRQHRNQTLARTRKWDYEDENNYNSNSSNRNWQDMMTNLIEGIKERLK